MRGGVTGAVLAALVVLSGCGSGGDAPPGTGPDGAPPPMGVRGSTDPCAALTAALTVLGVEADVAEDEVPFGATCTTVGGVAEGVGYELLVSSSSAASAGWERPTAEQLASGSESLEVPGYEAAGVIVWADPAGPGGCQIALFGRRGGAVVRLTPLAGAAGTDPGERCAGLRGELLRSGPTVLEAVRSELDGVESVEPGVSGGG